MTIDEAKQLIVDHGLRPLVQRGFYSHFIRAIDDTHTRWSATIDISRGGRVNRRLLVRNIRSMKLRTDTVILTESPPCQSFAKRDA